MQTAPVHVARYERRAALLSLVVSLLLLAIKFYAYLLTGSAAIFSDALESIVNVLASAFALYSVVLAHRPADREHPYGHGKVEFLSAGFEGGMILLAALVILVRSIEEIWRGPQVQQIDLGLLLIAGAMLVNGGVGAYLLRAARRYGSAALEADGRHLLTDTITSAAVLLGLGTVRLSGWIYADPLAAIVVAAYISWIGIGLLRRSASGLMDEQDLADEMLLRRLLDAHTGPAGRPPRICSYHKLRHRHSGRYHWVDFHIMVPATINIEQGHNIASALEYEIEQALGGNATAHVEPCQEQVCPTCAATDEQ